MLVVFACWCAIQTYKLLSAIKLVRNLNFLLHNRANQGRQHYCHNNRVKGSDRIILYSRQLKKITATLLFHP
jgi:hypothetical protein